MNNFNQTSTLPSSKSFGLTPMMAQYIKIKEEHLNEILFYRMGDFYEMFFDDAILSSSLLDITLTKRGQWNNNDIPMCGIPYHSADSYLNKLISKGFRVAICEQVKPKKDSDKKTKGPMERNVVRILTPGTILEENYLKETSNNFLCSWNEVGGEQSISWVDLSTGVFFTERLNKNLASSLENILDRLSPRELIIPFKMKDKKPKFYKECITFQADSLFNSEVCEKRLKKFYKLNSLVSFGNFNRSCISTAGAILGYIDLTQKGKLPLLKKLVEWKTSEIMEIDVFSRKSLELTKTQSGDSTGSFFNTINKTLTGGGSRLLLERLNSPLIDKVAINERLDTVSNFIKAKSLRIKLKEILKHIPDIERSITRLQFDRGGPRDLLSIKLGGEKASELLKLIVGYEFKYNKNEINNIIDKLTIDFEFVNKLNRAIIDHPPTFARDGDFIKKGFSKKLDEFKELKDKSKKHILSLQQKYIDLTEVQSLKIKYNNVLGYHIEVRRMHDSKIQSNPFFIHRQSTAQASRFTSTELADLEVKISEAGNRALEIELNIYNDLISECLSRSESWLDIFSSVSILDVSVCLADLANSWNYCRPEVSDGYNFSISSGRHPVVEQTLQNQSDLKFNGNDCNLEDKNIWLITGPNMGGKSTFLRQNALINIMAQMGSFVPAKKAKIGISDRIFSRVGTGDDLSKGQSTFMVEMTETASILNLASEKSFVILDEIGRGTATWDGLSLAWSIIENIHNEINCKTLFATHYHELTNLNKTLNKLSLYYLEAKEFNEEIVFLYKLIPGSANKSYGLEVAKLAGIPDQVIERAKCILKNLEKDNDLDAKLPLFEDAKIEIYRTNLALEELKNIHPDNISPLEALEILYKLKKLSGNII